MRDEKLERPADAHETGARIAGFGTNTGRGCSAAATKVRGTDGRSGALARAARAGM